MPTPVRLPPRRPAAPLAGDESLTRVVEDLLVEFGDVLAVPVAFQIVVACRTELRHTPQARLPKRLARLARRRMTVATSAHRPRALSGPDPVRCGAPLRPGRPRPPVPRRSEEHAMRAAVVQDFTAPPEITETPDRRI